MHYGANTIHAVETKQLASSQYLSEGNDLHSGTHTVSHGKDFGANLLFGMFAFLLRRGQAIKRIRQKKRKRLCVPYKTMITRKLPLYRLDIARTGWEMDVRCSLLSESRPDNRKLTLTSAVAGSTYLTCCNWKIATLKSFGRNHHWE